MNSIGIPDDASLGSFGFESDDVIYDLEVMQARLDGRAPSAKPKTGLDHFTSWLSRYSKAMRDSVEMNQAANANQRKIGAMIMPFVMHGQLGDPNGSSGRRIKGVGWGVGQQSIDSSGDGQYPLAWVIGCELDNDDVNVGARRLALSGLIEALEESDLSHSRVREAHFLALPHQSACWEVALKSVGFTTNGNTEIIQVSAGRDSVDFIPEENTLSATIHSIDIPRK